MMWSKTSVFFDFDDAIYHPPSLPYRGDFGGRCLGGLLTVLICVMCDIHHCLHVVSCVYASLGFFPCAFWNAVPRDRLDVALCGLFCGRPHHRRPPFAVSAAAASLRLQVEDSNALRFSSSPCLQPLYVPCLSRDSSA